LFKERGRAVALLGRVCLALAVAAVLTGAASQTQTVAAQTPAQSEGEATDLHPSQQNLEIPPAQTPARRSRRQKPQLHESENLALSHELETLLHQHRLPYVDALVYVGSGTSRRAVLSGSVATNFGRQDAAEKARQFLDAPEVIIVNQIVVDPAVRQRPPDRFVAQGNLGEILPRTFQGCWQGTVYTLDSRRDIPPFVMGNWMSETYRLCYLKHGDGPFQLTFSTIDMDPSSAQIQGIQIDDITGRVDVVSTDGSANAALHAYLHFRQKSPVLFGLLSAQSLSDESVDLSCAIVNGEMAVQAQFQQTCNGAPCSVGSWHQTFARSGS
jgi:hypothetical protein